MKQLVFNNGGTNNPLGAAASAQYANMLAETDNDPCILNYDEFIKREALYKYVLENTSLTAVPAIEAFADSAVETNLDVLQKLRDELKYPLTETKRSVNMNKIANMQPVEVWEELYKEVLELAYKFTVVDRTIFIESERGRLKEIANYCPYTFGNAVYVARGILAMIYGPAQKFYNDCEMPPRSSDKALARKAKSPTMQDIQPKENAALSVIASFANKQNVEAISLFPNPNNGSFIITSPSNNNRLVIENINGKLIDDKNYNTAYIEYSNKLAKGMYFYSLYSGIKLIGKGKFVVNE